MTTLKKKGGSHRCILSFFTNFGDLEKTGGSAQAISVSEVPKVDDPWLLPEKLRY